MGYRKNITVSSGDFSSLIFKSLSLVIQSSKGSLYTLSSITSSTPIKKKKREKNGARYQIFIFHVYAVKINEGANTTTNQHR